MKKWHKWLLGIAGAVVVVVIIAAASMWSSLRILAGTEAVSGESGSVPAAGAGKLQPVSDGSADWTSWLGPHGDRRSLVSGIRKDWSGGLTKLWEVDFLCQGKASATWSGPVVRGNRLVVVGRSSDSDLVFCLDPADGSLVWKASYLCETGDAHGAGPRATPAIDGDRVYTFGRGGILACWNLLDGGERWRASVADEGGAEPRWGHASSPLVLGDRVIVQGGGTARAIAFDKMTGKVAWKSGEGLAGYAAITSMPIAGMTAILTFHGKGLAAVDPRDGTVLWDVPWETAYDVNATTPVALGDRVLISSGYGTGAQMLKVSRTQAGVLWQNKSVASHHSDAYLLDGHIYGYSGQSNQNKGAFKCLSIADGTEVWSTNEMGWGTCMFADGHLICLDIEGNLFLMKPDPSAFVPVTRLARALGDVEGPVWTAPVAANGRVYLRFKQKLVCYDLVK